MFFLNADRDVDGDYSNSHDGSQDEEKSNHRSESEQADEHQHEAEDNYEAQGLEEPLNNDKEAKPELADKCTTIELESEVKESAPEEGSMPNYDNISQHEDGFKPSENCKEPKNFVSDQIFTEN